VIVWILEHGDNILGTVFVDPASQDQGVGTRTWQFIEATYPESRSWTLETPVWATKNHHFYEEKCGFHRVDVQEDTVVYRKSMRSW
jgi:N-acetylglutamate synthase-like GNAT family acetyltransferase